MKPSELKRIVNKEFNIDTLRAFQQVIEDRVYFVEKTIDLGTRPQIKGFMSHIDNIKEALKQLKEEKPGLWANIRAKRARGEKPAHKNSKAHKDAVKAGKKINAMSEDKTDAVRWFGNLKYFYQKAFAELKGEDREIYKQLAKDFFSKLEIDQKVRAVGLDEAEETYKVISKEKTTGFGGESYDKYTVDMGQEEYTTPEGLTFTLKVEGSALVKPGEKLDLSPGSKHYLYHASIDVDYKGKNLESIPGWATNYKNVKAQFTKAKRWLDKNGSKLIKGKRYQHKST